MGHDAEQIISGVDCLLRCPMKLGGLDGQRRAVCHLLCHLELPSSVSTTGIRRDQRQRAEKPTARDQGQADVRDRDELLQEPEVRSKRLGKIRNSGWNIREQDRTSIALVRLPVPLRWRSFEKDSLDGLGGA